MGRIKVMRHEELTDNDVQGDDCRDVHTPGWARLKENYGPTQSIWVDEI